MEVFFFEERLVGLFDESKPECRGKLEEAGKALRKFLKTTVDKNLILIMQYCKQTAIAWMLSWTVKSRQKSIRKYLSSYLVLLSRHAQ
ncbi:MAG: hypothetical protein RMM17_10855 [Acidobacteriota bacterium]|nr:hypothetical protein [Blastocatellia bacterium]MDW8413171.1 hypothetical protein [Acidobacteriota bacterium]